MAAKEVVISVEHVSKDFKLPHQKVGSIKGGFTSILSMRNRSFEVQHALKDIDFTVKKGEFFGIVGRNGSGKSTLLKILAGIYQPTKGSTRIEGRVVPFIELGVGFNGDLTGRENVYLNGALLGFSEKEIDAKYQDIMDFSELERFMDQKLKNYSSGMQVRLAFSVATRLAESDILLIDEVLAVGDADFQRKCFEYFRKLKRDNKTVVFVTHDMNAVREYCDRAILIEKNEIIISGSASKVASAYSRMFTKKSVKPGQQEDSSRWGDGVIEFRDITSPEKITDSDEYLVFNFKVHANELADKPLVGFMIKNTAGNIIAGTNTVIEDIKVDQLEPNQSLMFTVTIPNIFSDGQYYITLAAQYMGGNSTGDWWDDAIKITSLRGRATPYLVKPDIKIGVK